MQRILLAALLVVGSAYYLGAESSVEDPNFLKGSAHWQTHRPTIPLPGRVVRVAGSHRIDYVAPEIKVSLISPVLHDESAAAIIAILRRYDLTSYGLFTNTPEADPQPSTKKPEVPASPNSLRVDFSGPLKNVTLALRDIFRAGFYQQASFSPSLSKSDIKSLRSQLIKAAALDAAANAKEALAPFQQSPGEMMDINVVVDPMLFGSVSSHDTQWLHHVSSVTMAKPLSGDDFDTIGSFELVCLVDCAFAYHPKNSASEVTANEK